jgi:hypothetical protein
LSTPGKLAFQLDRSRTPIRLVLAVNRLARGTRATFIEGKYQVLRSLFGEQAIDEVTEADKGLVGLLLTIDPLTVRSVPGTENEDTGVDQEQMHYNRCQTFIKNIFYNVLCYNPAIIFELYF